MWSTFTGCDLPSQYVIYLPRMWSTFPGCDLPPQDVIYLPKMWSTFTGCDLPSQNVIYLPKMWSTFPECDLPFQDVIHYKYSWMIWILSFTSGLHAMHYCQIISCEMKDVRSTISTNGAQRMINWHSFSVQYLILLHPCENVAPILLWNSIAEIMVCSLMSHDTKLVFEQNRLNV